MIHKDQSLMENDCLLWKAKVNVDFCLYLRCPINMKTKEFLHYLPYLSLSKLWNLALLLCSYSYSRWSKKALHLGMPSSISVEPTTACNLKCPECPSGLRKFTRPTGNLKSDFFKRAIDQLSDRLISLTFYFQGEPYINPEFTEMVHYAHDRKIYTMTSTNAHFLDDENCRKTIESGLDKLIISLDGTTQEIYEQYRVAGDINKVIEGTKRMIRWKQKLKSKTPYLVFQFLVVKPNEHQIHDVQELAKSLGVDDVYLKTAQIYNYNHGSDLIPEQEIYSRYKKQSDGTYRIKNKLLNQCWRMWQGCVISWDGKIVPCCFDKDAEHKLGDLGHDEFKKIWRSPEYDKFRSAILRGRDQIDICTNCTEGTKVWAANES